MMGREGKVGRRGNPEGDGKPRKQPDLGLGRKELNGLERTPRLARLVRLSVVTRQVEAVKDGVKGWS